MVYIAFPDRLIFTYHKRQDEVVELGLLMVMADR